MFSYFSKESILLLFACSLLVACKANSDTKCENYTDCRSGEVCHDGVCESGRCENDDECGSGFICDHQLCELETSRDGGEEEDTTAAEDVNDEVNVDARDTNISETDEPLPVLILETDPPEGATQFPLDGTVSITFNQAMNEFRFTSTDNVQLFDSNAVPIEADILYDQTSFVLSIRPSNDGNFNPASPHSVRLSRFIGASESSENLGEPFYLTFSTIGYSNAEFHLSLATRYAPVVYQQTENLDLDTFTEVGFDGDQDPSNNFEHRADDHPGYAYYSVIESETHFFVTYFFYYPGVLLPSGVEREHDTLATTVIVRKTADPLGQFQAMNTLYQSYNLGCFR